MKGERHHLSDLYLPGLPNVSRMQHVFTGLLNSRLPKLAAHLRGVGVHPLMYSSQWVLTLFTYNFPFHIGTGPPRLPLHRASR